jgi:PAS domain S-box-containing protein
VATRERHVHALTRREALMAGQDMGEPDALHVLERLNEALYIIDADGRIQFCNAAVTQLTGYSAETLLGRPSLDLYAPEDRPAVLDRRTRAFQGEPVPSLPQATLLRHDGARLPVELSLTSLRREGQVVGRVAVVRDISARTRARAALRASEERFRLLVEGVQDYAIYLLDPEGRIVTWNTGAGRIKGYTAAEVLGRPFHHFFPPDEQARDTPAKLLAQAVRDGHFVGEGWRVRKDGSQFWASVVITALHGVSGELRGFAKVTRDITERRAAEQALAAANAALEHRVAERTAALQALNTRLETALKEKEILLKEIHHRVKNNLQVVSSLLSMQSETVQNPAIHDFVHEAERRLQAMALVHETLYQGDEVAQLPLAAYVETLSQQLAHAYGVDPGRLVLQLQVEGIILPLETAMPCGLILSELLSNCLKHAFPGGPVGDVTVTLSHTADHLTLRVSDSGCGFPEHVDFRHTESLGLQLVCLLTEQIEGTILLERDGGTTFTVTFPLPNSQPHGEEAAGGTPHP